MNKKGKLAKWIIEIVESSVSLNKDFFMKKMIEIGRTATNENVKAKMRKIYRKLNDGDLEYWWRIKHRIAKEKGWFVFDDVERGDLPPSEINSKLRSAYCYKCSGSLYSDIHIKCTVCDWLICPYDDACGCGYGYKMARVDFQ